MASTVRNSFRRPSQTDEDLTAHMTKVQQDMSLPGVLVIWKNDKSTNKHKVVLPSKREWPAGSIESYFSEALGREISALYKTYRDPQDKELKVAQIQEREELEYGMVVTACPVEDASAPTARASLFAAGTGQIADANKGGCVIA